MAANGLCAGLGLAVVILGDFGLDLPARRLCCCGDGVVDALGIAPIS